MRYKISRVLFLSIFLSLVSCKTLKEVKNIADHVDTAFVSEIQEYLKSKSLSESEKIEILNRLNSLKERYKNNIPLMESEIAYLKSLIDKELESRKKKNE